MPREMRLGKQDDVKIGRQARAEQGLQKRFEWLAGEIYEDGVHRDVNKQAREGVHIGDAACHFDAPSREEILQTCAGQWGSGDKEDAYHAATELLAGNNIPSCTVTRRILL